MKNFAKNFFTLHFLAGIFLVFSIMLLTTIGVALSRNNREMYEALQSLQFITSVFGAFMTLFKPEIDSLNKYVGKDFIHMYGKMYNLYSRTVLFGVFVTLCLNYLVPNEVDFRYVTLLIAIIYFGNRVIYTSDEIKERRNIYKLASK